MSKTTPKQHLLKAASATFSKYGFYKTAMEDIAAKAQKAKGSLYYHFGSKELLFEAVVLEELNQLKAALTVVFADAISDSRAILKNYMLKRMEVLRYAPNYQETLRPNFYEHYDFVNTVKEEMVQWEVQQIMQLIGRGTEEGQLELPGDHLVYSQVLVMLLQGLEPNFYLKGEYDRLEAHFDNLINIITKGISK
ncbi:TetR/AcrR family transcriptional regulator [uncultured Croceitalea sp.]|uniref:TetR/AcrR family transcriptional regulator n=1 Tax=uncultured Croceitalea sp. TaxID=1798908 RepID=UPI003305D45A